MTNARLPVAILIAGLIAYGVMLYRHLSFGAGGSDSSGYLNEARLMVSGRMIRPIAMLQTLHLTSEWGHVFLPLGFLSAPHDGRRMVPSYPPGLPAHFAVAGWIGGWSVAPFLVPLLAGLTSLALMFVLARQFGLSPWNALAASAILGICPIFLFMSAQPMSDIVATVWSIAAIVCALAAEKKPMMAAAAGAAFAIGVCIRPSNMLLAIAVGFALRWRVSRLAIAVAAATPFAIALMVWNNALFGNPLRTGYGDMDYMLSWANYHERFPHYTYWLAVQLSPLIFPGGLLVAFDRRVESWRRALLLSWFVPFFVFYCFYGAYETWWYTRFLLPAIPPLIIGFFLLIRDLRTPRVVMAILVVAILAVALREDRKIRPLAVGEGESIYPEVVHWAEQRLPPDALVVTHGFSGSFLYYSGRSIVRWDQLDQDQFELLRAYVGAANLRWYALVSSEEFMEVQTRMPGVWTPIGTHRYMTLYRLDS